MARDNLKELARQIRKYILISTSAAGSGHPTSSLSAVELMTVLFFKYFRKGDRLIFSKGHASPLFYALYTAAGKISEKDLMKYRTFDSVLEGHPSMRFPYTEVPTGSLGQGLAVGAGEALGLQLMGRLSAGRSSHFEMSAEGARASARDRTAREMGRATLATPRVYVLLGDGELAEGSTWEAASWAANKKLINLFAIADINRLGQSEDTMFGYDIGTYKKRFEAFGWKTAVLSDGNNLAAVDAAFRKITAGPTIILAKTVKGKGVSFLEGKHGWHGKALGNEELEKALYELRSG